MRIFLLVCLLWTGALRAQEEDDVLKEPPRPKGIGPNATLTVEELAGFDELDPRTQELIRSALALTRRDLTYTFGSADPDHGGMDCSGTIYYLLQSNGYKDAPRTASRQYLWVRLADRFHAVISHDPDSAELDQLRPGDLLFWTGTYDSGRDPPVTHSMIYLGREKKDDRPVMVGASNGRSYRGEKRWGVSVFDFKAGSSNPKPGKVGTRFIGYGKLWPAEH